MASLAAAGCSGGATAQDPPATQQRHGLADVDPCALLTPDELGAFGFEGPGQPDNGISSEPGCSFEGSPFGVTFYKNQEKSVESYGRQDNWAKFDRVE
ncbi:DUF3558 family protein, partial [Saccharopolyspora thermophila]|uniref:DUF3558 family protein n=1 Tax=Saccharopolyspora thermophila TaxID=89367 RepID=UPI0031F923CE